jgi:hypothetical protein
MRTTIDIDDDLLAAAKELARREGCSAGEVVSRLLRATLTGQGVAARPSLQDTARSVAGFVPFPAREGVVATNEHVNRLRDAEGI